MTIICISGKAQHGKDTAAEIFKKKLEERGGRVLLTHYADLLKWMCSNYFGWNGLKDDAGRTLLQRIGTDTIRNQIPDFWVNWVIQILNLFPNEWDYVIIPDCRFPNEIQALQREFLHTNKADVFHFRIERPNFESSLTAEQKNHISETALDHFGYNRKIINTDLSNLSDEINKTITEYLAYELAFQEI